MQGREVEERFLLYIDILNFSNLVAQKGKVEELYEIINRLHVHRHDVFTTKPVRRRYATRGVPCRPVPALKDRAKVKRRYATPGVWT
jgi:hypothetical protein